MTAIAHADQMNAAGRDLDRLTADADTPANRLALTPAVVAAVWIWGSGSAYLRA